MTEIATDASATTAVENPDAPGSAPAPKRSEIVTRLLSNALLSTALTKPMPNAGLRISAKGLALIKSFEGCLKKRPDGTLEAYRCPAGVPTIGWGCTEGVKMGMVITVDEAEAMLRRELSHFEIVIGRLVRVALSQGEFDALVSFVYNVGDGALAKSTLLKLLNAGNYSSVANQMLRWTRGGGRVLPGLVRRRKAEGALFISGIHNDAAVSDDYGPMPQKVEREKGSRVEVVKKSRTFWGSILALFGYAGTKANEAFGLIGDAAQQAEASTSGVRSMLGGLGKHAELIGGVILVTGILMAIAARFDAAAEEKVG